MKRTPENEVEFLDTFKRLKLDAERVQSIASLTRIHDLLYFSKREGFTSWGEFLGLYREMSDKIIEEINRERKLHS